MRISSRQLAGFTLIELLVVMAIVSILAGLIIPVFTSVRHRAYATACSSNLHQLGLAIGMYNQDYDEHYPWGADMVDLHTSLWSTSKDYLVVNEMLPINVVVRPYVSNVGVWRCPADTGYDSVDIYSTPGKPILLNARPSAFEAFGMSYAYNTSLPLTQQLYGNMIGVNPDEPNVDENASQVLLLIDSCGDWHGVQSIKHYNVLMCDGHLESENYLQMYETLNIVMESGIPLQ